jgi:hypothetical protein
VSELPEEHVKCIPSDTISKDSNSIVLDLLSKDMRVLGNILGGTAAVEFCTAF